MPKAPPRYRKLPGRASGVAGITRVWLAEDHFLSVHTMFGVERYRRFYFRDIEAFIILNTKVRFGWNIGLGVTVAICAGLAILGFRSRGSDLGEFPFGAAIFFSIIGGMSLLLLLVNTLRGQTCRIYLQTAAGLQDLAVPRRLGGAMRVLKLAEPGIRAAQAEAAARLAANPIATAAAAAPIEPVSQAEAAS